MILRNNKTFEINSLFLNTDWYNEDNYVIDETNPGNQELIDKIKEHAPYMELVITNNKVIDVIPLEKPIQPEPQRELTVKDRLTQLEVLTVNNISNQIENEILKGVI